MTAAEAQRSYQDLQIKQQISAIRDDGEQALRVRTIDNLKSGSDPAFGPRRNAGLRAW
jgi:hypothetical protein